MKPFKLLRQPYLACLAYTLGTQALLIAVPTHAKPPAKPPANSTQLTPVPASKSLTVAELKPLTPGEVQARKVNTTKLPEPVPAPQPQADTVANKPQALASVPVNAALVPQAGLSLSQLLQAAADTYPMLIAARTETRATAQDVTATERLRWPTLSTTVESDSGNLRSYPNKVIQVDQTLWDAGRNSARINEAKVVADISLIKVYLQQQDVFLQIVNAWQNMISSRERLKVAERTQSRLQAYQQQMRRRVQAEASPVIDLELVDSRLLQTDVELNAAKTSLQVALTRLTQFTCGVRR